MTEMQDNLGNVLHPETEAKYVSTTDGSKTLDDKLLEQALITNQQLLEVNTLKKIMIPSTVIDSAYYIDTFTTTTNVTVSHGTYNGTTDRIQIDDNAFIRSISFSYIL
jgi:hypothetical protein